MLFCCFLAQSICYSKPFLGVLLPPSASSIGPGDNPDDPDTPEDPDDSGEENAVGDPNDADEGDDGSRGKNPPRGEISRVGNGEEERDEGRDKESAEGEIGVLSERNQSL